MKKITLLLFTLLTFSILGQDKLTSSLIEYNNGTAWENSYKSEFIYDNNNNLIEETELNWNFSTSNWKNSEKTFYTYNSNNKATVVLNQNFDSNNSVTDQYRTTYTYNFNGEVIQFMDEEWNGTTWVKAYKLELTYSGDKISSGVNYQWNGTDWGYGDDSSNITLNYNGNGTIGSSVSDTWNGSTWETSDRTIFSYDGNNNIILQDNQEWNGSNWTSYYKTEKTYDSNANAITEKKSYLEDGSFVAISNEAIAFDTSVLMSNFAHPFKDKTGLDFVFSGNGIVNKIVSKTGVNTRTTYYYGNEPTASVNDFNVIGFSVYPNPTTSIVTIDDSNFSIKNVELYSVIGKKVISTSVNKLNLQSLVNGVYLMRVETESGKFATKRVIKN